MTRSELIQTLSSKLDSKLSAKEVEAAVKNIFEDMGDALAAGYRIELRGIGSFSVRYREPRAARNPKTGETVQKEGKYTVHYKPGKEMRERVNASAVDYPLLNME